ncbi:membrane protein insertase YidC [Pseudoxanthomonas dokdonensis]|uniref:Membrane protein insertase YidC n=1 Tax=Pseudoxanthomonas dokdonensis TaxID=344882 RepID=A0A0R0D094_9GAMM|nr:membrane protein insertase YidC [Pseudoxanthomonas dokdonensis]KRG72058.1 insertase [Pseudoxanthomonas dokdonensis]
MNQTRIFLIFAWLMVATLLWMEWGKFNAPKPAPATTTAVTEQIGSAANGNATSGTVPSASGMALPGSDAGAVPTAPAAMSATTASPSKQTVSVTTDVLKVVLDGGSVLQADLLAYPQSKGSSTPVRLFNQGQHPYAAQSGWLPGQAGAAAPNHETGFVPEQAGAQVLADGADSVSVPFIWNGPDGVSIRRTYTFSRGNYVVQVQDQVINAGSKPWQGYVYRQLIRNPPPKASGMHNPESFSFTGATWYDGDYQRRKFNEDYLEDGKVNKQTSKGWIAMLQHHFFTAWIPQASDTTTLSLDQTKSANGIDLSVVREVGPGVNVAPGQQATTSARLWVGPKLVDKIKAEKVPGLDRAVDYSQFSIFALIGQGLFWILSHLHAFIGNWGWSIVGLVVIVKLALYPLSAAQYRSFAKMRKFQPRIAQLKERYGDDRQKFQTAMMELYKKEKINPMGGCLPILVQMPIFLSLYWVLNESVELRQAPWAFWIHDLTARDPYFILPVVNMLVMWATQKLTPAQGMDPMQQKMMQFMPLVFGAMMAFFPSGLVLYWVTNGALGLLQQWWVTRRFGHEGKPDVVTSK